jgi:hypothetical protein
MTEKPDPRARLVSEVFGDDWGTGPASAFARSAAAYVRQRRRRRRNAVAVAGVAALAALVFAAYLRPHQEPALAPVSEVKPGTKATPLFEIISDEQLMAELRDQPLLILPQDDGSARFVVLSR